MGSPSRVSDGPRASSCQAGRRNRSILFGGFLDRADAQSGDAVLLPLHHDEALAVDAGLAVIVEPRLRANLGSEIEIGVFEHQMVERIVARGWEKTDAPTICRAAT